MSLYNGSFITFTPKSYATLISRTSNTDIANVLVKLYLLTPPALKAMKSEAQASRQHYAHVTGKA